MNNLDDYTTTTTVPATLPERGTDRTIHAMRRTERGWIIRPVQESDYEKLAALLKAVWNINATMAYWHWKFSYNRGNYSGSVVDDGNGIIAFTGLFFRSIMWHGTEIHAEWIVDLMAHPSQKGKAYPFILAELKKVPYRSLLGGYHNYAAGRVMIGGLKKTNTYRLTAQIPRYCLILDPSVVLRGMLQKPLCSITRSIYKNFYLRKKPNNVFDIEETQLISSEFDVLWHRISDSYTYVQYRGSDYLRWRFQEMPQRTHQIWAARRKGVLEGYMVTTMVKGDEESHGTIVDWFMPRTTSGLFSALLKKALLFFVHNNVVTVDIYIMSHERQWISILQKNLFIKRNGRPFTIFADDTILQGKPLSEEMLFITPGDSDFPGAEHVSISK